MTAATGLPPLDLSRRFDGEEAWWALAPPVRTAIGAGILACLAAERLTDYAAELDDPRLGRLGITAERVAEIKLSDVFREISLSALIPDLPSGEPPIPAILGMVCALCGCSERDPCPEGCGWARANLCTACAAAGSAAARAEGA